MRVLPLILIIAIGLGSSCTTDSAKSDLLDFTLEEINYQTPDCEPERDACLMVKLSYAHFHQGDSMAKFLANRIIKNSTLDFIGMGDVEATTEPSLDQAVVDLDNSFSRLKKDFGPPPAGWEANMSTNELFKSDSILVLEVGSMAYFGGAHPNSNIRYFNFNRRTGGLVPLTELVGNLTEFAQRAELVFNEKYLEDGESYADAGFSFLGGKYILSANYAVVEDSILLHYNKYEISSYAAGDFDITVSRK